MMPEDGIEQLSGFDAIYLGAVGFPGVPDHISLWGLLIPIRREFEQYINLRPVRLFEGAPCPLAGKQPGDIDFLVVRENCEGEYSNVGGRLYAGTEDEVVIQQSIFTRKGVDRVVEYAFELAQNRPRKKLVSATKSNGIIHTMPFWDERVAAISKRYPDVDVEKYHIDSDLGPGITGTIAIAPSANINPEGHYPSMFEPVHGSAPDIAGKNIANPIGQIWSGAMLLAHFGHQQAHDAILEAIEQVIRSGEYLTPDMGGKASTQAAGHAIAAAI